MKKIIALILCLTMILGATAALGSCGAPDDPGAKIAIYLGEEVYDFDPTEYYVDDNAIQMLSLIYEPLFRLDDDGDRKKAAADDYEIDEEERKISIELRETYWSDNARVTADDFIFAWRNVLLDPSNANPSAALLFDIENAVSVKNGICSIYDLGVSKLDPYTLEITYRDGADPESLLDNLASIATAPVRQDKYENSEGFWSKQTSTMVFNGPFKVVELDYDQTGTGSFKLERNLGYHQSPDKKDYDNEVRPYRLYAFYNADGSQIKYTYAQLEKNTVFYMCDAPLSDRAANKDEATVVDTFSTYSYVFNFDNPLFKIKEVRQALSVAIDRNAIVNKITFGAPATGFVPPVVEDAATEESFREGYDLISASANISKANKLLSDEEVAAKIEGLDKTIVLTVNDDEQSKAIAEIVKASWEKLDIGLSVEVEVLGSMVNLVTENDIEVLDSWIQYIVKSKALGTESEYDPNFTADQDRYDAATKTYYSSFDVIALDWQFFVNDAFVGLSSMSTAFGGMGVDFDAVTQRNNISGWKNNDYNAYLTQAYKALDEETRSAALHSAEKILVDESPIVPLVFNQNFSFCSKQLKKVDVDGFGFFVFTDAKLKKYEKYLENYND